PEIASSDGKLYANKSTVIVAVDKRRAGTGSNRSNFLEGNLTSSERRNQNVRNLSFRLPILIRKPKSDIKFALALVHYRRSLPSYRHLDYGLSVGSGHSVEGHLVIVQANLNLGLPHVSEHTRVPYALNRFDLTQYLRRQPVEHVEVRSKYLDCIIGIHPRNRLSNVVDNRLGIVVVNSLVLAQLLVHFLHQVIHCNLPAPLLPRFQVDLHLNIVESTWIRPIV